MSVGDVNSTEKGSGARYNTGKIPLELVPFNILALFVDDPLLRLFLETMHKYQFSGDQSHLVTALRQIQGVTPACARVFDYGRTKYAEWNWLKGMAWSIPLACIGRHAMKINSGEDLDDESGLSHWGHIMCNLVMLHTYADVYPEGNDLPTPPKPVEELAHVD